MNRILISAVAAALLSGCAEKNNVNITHGTPRVQTNSRSEPIFYNGKTYELDYSYAESSTAFEMRVSGMGPKQQKDAVAVATSSLGYFACPDGQRGHMIGSPNYSGGVWKLQAKCA